MTFLLAGLMAAGFCWLLNGHLAGVFGRFWMVIPGPALEELLKTGISLLLGADILAGHLVFGAVEALRDLQGGKTGDILAAAASLAGHGFFGLLAATVYVKTGLLWVAVVLPLIAHFLWNAGMLLWRSRLTGPG